MQIHLVPQVLTSCLLLGSLASATRVMEQRVLPQLVARSDSNGNTYSIRVEIGTPAQDIYLRVDIAQPYMWVVGAGDSHFCYNSTNISACGAKGVYNSSESSTYTDLGAYQEYSFLDGIEVNGSVAQDVGDFFSYDNKSGYLLNSMQFISADNSSVGVGAIGLSGRMSDDSNSQFSNISFMDNLVAQGISKTKGYSFFPQNRELLTLTFGGFDPEQFVNSLVVFKNIPFLSDSGKAYTNFPIVPLTGLSVVNNNGNAMVVSNEGYPVLLDSRSTYSLLAYQTLINIAVQLNAYYSYDYNVWLLKCSTGKLGASLAFQFGNLTIEVPVSSFLSNLTDDQDNQVIFDGGDPACLLTILPDTNYGFSVLGTNFLRSAFLAVDLESQQIALAQANNELFKNETRANTALASNITTTAAPDLPIPDSSYIQSGTIPFAVPNNITSGYDQFTFSFNTASLSSSIPPDITARVTHGVIYTGRAGASVSSSAPENTHAPTSTSVVAAGASLTLGTGLALFGLIFSLF